MKTNQNLIRKMGEYEVLQRTKDGMFYATGLLKKWNSIAQNKQRDLDNFWKGTHLCELMQEIAINELEFKSVDFTELKNKLSSISRGKYGGTWLNPFLFIKFAMWLNPKFEYQVIKFVYDELIKHRHLSGDYYNKLCSALAQFPDVDYREIGKMLNYVVFNEHETAIRNKATPEQQQDLQLLERDMCKYLEMGFIKSFEHFKSIMRIEWGKRHSKAPWAA